MVLPAALSMGSYEIQQIGHHGPGTLFEGKVVFDKKYGSVTYGCATCCGYQNLNFQFYFNPLAIPLDSWNNDQGVEGYDVCDGQWVDLTSDFYSSWSTLNQAVATVNANGYHYGAGVGSTTTKAYAQEQIFNEKLQCPIEGVTPSGNDNVTPTVTFDPPISSVAVGQTATTTANGTNGAQVTLSISGGAMLVSPSPPTFTTSASVVVKGVTAGSATLSATITNPDGGGTETIGTDDFTVKPSATITVHFTGSKTSGDNLSFDPGQTQTCSESLGLLNCASAWVWNVEIEASVSDDASSWLAEQSSSGLEKGFWKDSTGTLHSYSISISAPDDDPASQFVQQPAGQKTIFWLDSPGRVKLFAAGEPVDSMTRVENFTSMVCSSTDTSNCYPVSWYVKLVVKSGGILDTVNSQAGFGTLPTNF